MKVLVVSPHFPPTNAADMHRVRLLCPHLASVGIEPHVFAVGSNNVASPVDDWMMTGLPRELPVTRVEAMGLKWGKIPGMGSLDNRSRGALRKVGTQLIRDASRQGGPFDLIYFSTTQFGIHNLGPYWKKRFGIPFVMDYQDPWVNNYYRDNLHIIPPGGRLKYGIASWIGRRSEPRVLKVCSGITSVSDAYPAQLKQRYDFLAQDWPVLVAPFPGDMRDLQRVESDATVQQSVFDPDDGNQHWVYVGRGGDDMHTAVRGLFAALRNLLNRDRGGNSNTTSERSEDLNLERLRIHFVGTSYAAKGAGTKTIQPLAAEFGLEGIVNESTDRIAYSHTLRCLLDADALIVPGSNDAGYTASKIYPYLLADKPLLGIFHEESSVTSLIEKVGGGSIVSFNDRDDTNSIAGKVEDMWLSKFPETPYVPLDKAAFEPHTARSQAMQIAQFFKEALQRERK